jgi:ribosome recycling factor
MKVEFQESTRKMEKTLEVLREDFGAIRAGRANARVLDRIRVEYYGAQTPINQIAGIKTPDARLLVIEPWDKGALKAIERAIMESDLGVNPSNDGMVIRLPFPELTEERRRELAKQCKGYAEEARVSVRNARRDANTALGKAEKAGDITEDDQSRGEKQIQKLTDQYVAKVDELFKKKEAEIMTI